MSFGFSTHAIERFIERTGAVMDIDETRPCLMAIFRKAKEQNMSFRKDAALHYLYTGIQFVITGETCKTVLIQAKGQARTTLSRTAKEVLGKEVTYQ